MRKVILIKLLMFTFVIAIGQDAKFLKRGFESFIVHNQIEFRICQSENNIISLHYILHDSIDNNTSSITIPPIVKYNNTDYIVKYIDDYGLYSKCKLYLPNTIEVIGIPAYTKGSPQPINKLFSNEELKSKPWTLQIPSSVSYINSESLKHLNLISIEVEKENKAYCSINGIIYNKTVTELTLIPKFYKKQINFPPTVKIIGPYAFYGSQKIKTVKIPSTINKIGNGAFAYSSIKKIDLPSSLDSIGEKAFSGSKIKEISIPSSVKYLGGSMFSSCSRLKKCILPSSIKIIPEYFFEDCQQIKSITLPMGIQNIERYAFNGCINLKRINLPDSLLIIGKNAFRHCSKITHIDLPNKLKFIGQDAFTECTSLKSINLPQSIENTDQEWFKHLDMRHPCCGEDKHEFSAPVF